MPKTTNTMRYQFIPVRMANMHSINNVGGNMKKLESMYIVDGNVK
jgi:hypothetical protein